MSLENLIIRAAVEEDLKQIALLFEETIISVNAADYNEEQIKLWSTRDDAFWQRRFKEQYFLVAEDPDTIVGFSSLTETGYIDFMYVHKDYQRKGVAKKLLQQIEKHGSNIGLNEVHSHVSITAKSFFLQQGFTLMKQRNKKASKTSLINYEMQKFLK